MPRPKVKVRSKTTGLTAFISPDALRHFPDFERADAPQAPPTEHDSSPAGPVENPKPSTRRSTAANTTDKE
jgi:hypothetical protein